MTRTTDQTTAPQLMTTQVYSVYIRATPEAFWDAITKPEWTEKYGYGGRADYDLRPGGAHRVRATDDFRAEGAKQGFDIPEIIIDGEVIESDPPHKLVFTWRMLMDPELAAEGFTRITHEITPLDNGVTKLTVVHELPDAPKLALLVSGALEDQGAGGGHAWVLSDLKTLLETGTSFSQRAR